MKFKVMDYEMVHYAYDNLFIAHKADIITYIKDGNQQSIKMPNQLSRLKKLFISCRKARRLLRLDKAMIQPIDDGFVMFRFNSIWIYRDNQWIESNQKLNCRNPMYNGFLRLDDGTLYIGEYGNPDGNGKRVLKSIDNGLTWECVYKFKPLEIRHIHCLDWDPFENKIWIATGDSDNESTVLKSDIEFKNVEKVGGGSQVWRTCHFVFTKENVEWFMDSPLEDVFHVVFDRTIETIEKREVLSGPIWFARQYKEDTILAASAQEKGVSHKDKLMHLYKIKNGILEDVYQFKYDGWPKGYFRFGTITLTRSDNVIISCEGVKGFDGKSLLCEAII